MQFQFLEIEVAWPLIQASARKRMESGSPLQSQKQGKTYPTLHVEEDAIFVDGDRQNGSGKQEYRIGRTTLATSLDKLQQARGRLKRRDMNIVVVEATIVELHPHLEWSEDADYIVYNSPADEGSVIENLEQEEDEDIEEIKRRNKRGEIDSTTAERLIKARRGQGAFRTQVLKKWGHRCAVTGSGTLQAIRASHIKPWRESPDDEERLDPYNGLPLIASLDALFDAGLISFEASGEMIVSSRLSAAERRIFGVDESSLSKRPAHGTAEYLVYHRRYRFEP